MPRSVSDSHRTSAFGSPISSFEGSVSGYLAVRGRLSQGGGMLQVPEALAERARRDLGPDGRSWIEHLPEVVAAAEARWSLTSQSVLPVGKELSLLMAVTTAAGHPAVLKASYPDARPRLEAAALSQWAGNGAAAP